MDTNDKEIQYIKRGRYVNLTLYDRGTKFD